MILNNDEVKDIVAELEEVARSNDLIDVVHVSSDYSGRGMFGATCISVTCPWEYWDEVGHKFCQVAGDEASQDSMGLDGVFYWRHLKTGESYV